MRFTIYKLRFTRNVPPALRAVTAQRAVPTVSTFQRFNDSTSAAFTMMEIAISLAVIGIALVAIIGVLPIGMNVQQANREETVIGQDANVLMEDIRRGSLGSDDLTNYIYAISNYWGFYSPGVTPYQGVNGYTYGSVSVDPKYPGYTRLPASYQVPITNGANIIGLLSTPEYIGANGVGEGAVPGQPIPSLFFGGISNHIVAYCYSISGPAIEKPPQDNQILQQDSFGYHLFCVNAPAAIDTNLFFLGTGPWSDTKAYSLGYMAFYNWMYWTYAGTVAASGNLPGTTNLWQMSPNYSLEQALNLHELRLTFEWPALAKGNVGPGRETFRTLMAGQLTHQPQLFFNFGSPVNSVWYNSNLWCYLPETFTNTP
ncbi:MAG TPA: type II secretion system protein [Verrucomicrobiae bacterium]|jgi:type II secretory pathway pseudopilin PulG